MSKNFLDSVDLTVPFGSASNLQSCSGSHRPWVKSWLPGLALKASYSLVPGNLSAFLPPALSVYGQKATHTFCVSLAVSYLQHFCPAELLLSL